MPEAPKYTRAQIWLLILLGSSIVAVLIGAGLPERHFLALGTVAYSASMTWGCLWAMQKMRANGEIYLQGWGLVQKAENPVLWIGVWVALCAMPLMMGAGAIIVLLSVA